MRTNEEIVRILIDEKNKQKLSISELARRVDMAKSAISRYFNFTREFPLNRADDFAKVLGISTEYLLGISKEETSNNEEIENPPLIQETIRAMEQLDSPRQKIVLETAKSQLKDQEKETAKVISLENKKSQQTIDLAELVDDSKIDWDKWVSFEGKPLTDEAKEEMKRVLGKRLENKDK
ncbi:XRE family transcriptional regulator [Lactococcus lactis]|uniref:XRE family transcriptional regulator n=1 Tax=Lactococcus lactis TaxID=1358 RepID=UPI000BA58F9D|nr:XRE family transcriptional regulator [Lactococcus lactis]PAK67969.1 phage repressor protein [Lactococcus lactis]PEN19430.1 XRE family transcriptional regulator [Lactococcus lactis]TYR25427.1 helix-turn-helix domain-containing protein [Lactococcus lactis subsp. lactis bv. diacetylactis]